MEEESWQIRKETPLDRIREQGGSKSDDLYRLGWSWILRDVEAEQSLISQGYLMPTPIQQTFFMRCFRSLPPRSIEAVGYLRAARLNRRNDFLLQAKSGMGKTVLIAVALIKTIDPYYFFLWNDVEGDDFRKAKAISQGLGKVPQRLQSLVLCPTLETSVQLHDELRRIFTNLNRFLTKGKDLNSPWRVSLSDIKDLRKSGPQVLVSTPSRLLALLGDPISPPKNKNRNIFTVVPKELMRSIFFDEGDLVLSYGDDDRRPKEIRRVLMWMCGPLTRVGLLSATFMRQAQVWWEKCLEGSSHRLVKQAKLNEKLVEKLSFGRGLANVNASYDGRSLIPASGCPNLKRAKLLGFGVSVTCDGDEGMCRALTWLEGLKMGIPWRWDVVHADDNELERLYTCSSVLMRGQRGLVIPSAAEQIDASAYTEVDPAVLSSVKIFKADVEIVPKIVSQVDDPNWWAAAQKVKFEKCYTILTRVGVRQAIVFVNHSGWAKDLERNLRDLGLAVCRLGSTVPKYERVEALLKARQGIHRIIIASDVAARGLDLPAVDLVIQLSSAADVETWLHRIGRASRMGACGSSVSVLLPEERGEHQYFLQQTSATDRGELPIN